MTRHLVEAGARVKEVRPQRESEADACLDIDLDGTHARFVVEIKRRAPYPNELPALNGRHRELSREGIPLLVAPFINEKAGKQYIEAQWSWADEEGNFDLRAPGIRLRQRTRRSPRPHVRRTLPGGSGANAIIRQFMFADPQVPPTITEIAFDAGVSQPRASQVVAALAKLELAYRSEDGRWHAHRSELFERFVAEYRGPGGSLHYFYSLDEPLHSATVLVRRLNDHASEPPSVLVSGDVAADEIVPWRRPSHLVLYSRSVPHEMPGIVPAHGPADSNVRIRVPEDRSVWLGARLHPSAGLPLADAAQIVWDLRDLGGEDRADHAGRLVERIVSQW